MTRDDADRLDAVRKPGTHPAAAPPLPSWAREYAEDLQAIITRHQHRARAPWHTDPVWRDISTLCQTVHDQRKALRERDR